jgi:diguanylate cyclase (GGDEF)-like protein
MAANLGRICREDIHFVFPDFQKKSFMLPRLLELAAADHTSPREIARDYLQVLCLLTDAPVAALINGKGRAWIWNNATESLSSCTEKSVPEGLTLKLQRASSSGGKLVLPSRRTLGPSEAELAGLAASAMGRALDRFSFRASRMRRGTQAREREQILKRFLSGGSIADALNSIAALVGRHAGCKCSVLALDGWAVECVSAPDLSPEYRSAKSALRALPRAFAEHISGIRAIGALNERSRHIELAASLGYKYFDSTPLMSRSGDMLGFLLIHCEEPPTRAASRILRDIRDVAALVMEHRRFAIRSGWAAAHDPLTGLGNRQTLDLALRAGLAAVREGTAMALIFIRMDRFRTVNGGLGHTAGDLALRRTAERIVSTLSEGQTATRPGSDEFAVVVTGRADEDTVILLAEEIRREIASPFKIEGHQVMLTCSIGISMWPVDGQDAETLLRNAEIAASRARERDGRRIVIHSGDTRPARFAVERGLQTAVAQNELEPRYQPVVSIDGAITGFEVLLSWKHPEFGQIPAKHFIPIAEEADLIFPIGEWVLRRACEQAVAWRDATTRPLRFWVNVSARQFANSAFADAVRSAIADSGVDASCLVLELTETAIMRNLEESKRLMAELRELGVKLAIDDFGSGYSSLNYLWTLPVDAIKIDQSLVADLSDSDRALAIMETLVGLGHTLGLDVVAEGVESEEQFEIVRRVRCDLAQGYLFAMPMPIHEAEELIRSA